jgi:hypothetical protein
MPYWNQLSQAKNYEIRETLNVPVPGLKATKATTNEDSVDA